jgi:hypothetical protein
MKRVWILGGVALLLAGCNASISDVGGGKLSATGCRPHVPAGRQLTVRLRWTAPNIAKYTHVRLDGATNFTIQRIFEESLARTVQRRQRPE